jgi:hypothetical protein
MASGLHYPLALALTHRELRTEQLFKSPSKFNAANRRVL